MGLGRGEKHVPNAGFSHNSLAFLSGHCWLTRDLNLEARASAGT